MVASRTINRLLGFGASFGSFILGLDPSSSPSALDSPAIAFGEDWQILGPFQIGTREAIWGADPLEYHGGFHALQYDEHASFKSSLAFNGSVHWSNTKAELARGDGRSAGAHLKVSFPSVDWPFLQQVYGWAALQWQGWARGQITVQGGQAVTLTLNVEHVLEFWIDNRHYFGGDFYGFGRAPVVLHLHPGVHRIDVRLVRDVRAMGGITDDPAVDIKLELQHTSPGLHRGGDVLFPDRLGDEIGPLASTYASVVLRNDNSTDLYIESIEAKHNACKAHLIAPTPIRLVPGQSRPIGFQIDCIPGTSAYASIDLHFNYVDGLEERHEHTLFVGVLCRVPQSMHGAHLFTFLHPGNIVSYAILKPPSPDAHCPRDKKLPVLMQLHGAGLEADSEPVKHALDSVKDLCAWVLFPTGVTPWSGDDWHNWGFADVEAAVAAIPDWIEQVEWTGPGVNIDKWLVSGHSNGGQGTWYAITHRPDKVIAAAPVSGYTSIQTYVPYTFWRPADPGRSRVLDARLSSYRHELMLENARDVPILQQHGSADDNVPAYHSRLMYELLQQSGATSNYIELEGQPHWWDSVMTTPQLSSFYKKYLALDYVPDFPPTRARNFTMVTSNPADMGSKAGIRILALQTPEEFGHVELEFANLTKGCAFKTFNVGWFELPHDLLTECYSISVDGVQIKALARLVSNAMTLSRTLDGGWKVFENETSAGWRDSYRNGRQQGGMEAILRTHGTLQIVQHSNNTDHVALQISRNLCQYFAADTDIREDFPAAVARPGNIISIAVGNELPPPAVDLELDCPVLMSDSGVSFTQNTHGLSNGYSIEYGHVAAAIFLRPLPDQRLELVVWAVDVDGLEIAARLVPMMTGTGQPDFVVANRRMLDKGLDGVLAMGFFNGRWCPSSNSFFASTQRSFN